MLLKFLVRIMIVLLWYLLYLNLYPMTLSSNTIAFSRMIHLTLEFLNKGKSMLPDNFE